jgi:hypothetical protein
MQQSSTIGKFSFRSATQDGPVTQADLQQFKADLLKEISLLVRNIASPSGKQWIKSYEVRQILHLSPGTLQTLRNNGTLPFTRIGGTLYYDMEDIKKLLSTPKNGIGHARE